MSGRTCGWICAICLVLTGRIAGAPDGASVQPQSHLRRTMRDLWRAGLTPPADVSSGAVGEAARKVAAIRLAESRPAASRPAVTPPLPDQVPTPGPRTGVDAETLARIQALPPDQPDKAVALADALFRGGYLEPAYVLYERAFQREPPGETQGWVLFQMANCRRPADADAARKLYQRLVTEYPDSPWSISAACQERLIEWRQANELGPLLERAATPLARAPQAAATTRPGASKAGKS